MDIETLFLKAMAQAIDDFWRSADAVWQRSQDIAQRSASRLQARLARRNHASTITATKV